MEELLTRVWENLGDRITGPMRFRLVLQPLVASVFAVRAALSDARAGRPAYLWAVFTDVQARRDLLKEGWASIAKVFVMAMIVDVIYQLIVLGWVYPVETFVVAFLLAVLPYILIRGPLNRILAALGFASKSEEK